MSILCTKKDNILLLSDIEFCSPDYVELEKK